MISVIFICEYLKEKHKVNAFSAILAREEGVYKIPNDAKKQIQKAYYNLTKKINNDLKKNNDLYGYKNSLQAKVMNQKNKIVYYKLSLFYSSCWRLFTIFHYDPK